jgi:hypothetical protein
MSLCSIGGIYPLKNKSEKFHFTSASELGFIGSRNEGEI